MSSKEARECPICHCPDNVNLSQHLKGVHGIGGQERRQLIQRGIVDTEVMTTEPQSNIEKHIVFLDMLQRGELLRSELLRKARPEELKAIFIELCLNMKEGNLTMPTRNPHRTIVTTLAKKNISLSNKKWMLEYSKILYNIISPALKEWKRKFRRI